MKKYTETDINSELANATLSNCDRDNEGQVMYYTGIYEWKDGTFRGEPDPSLEEE